MIGGWWNGRRRWTEEATTGSLVVSGDSIRRLRRGPRRPGLHPTRDRACRRSGRKGKRADRRPGGGDLVPRGFYCRDEVTRCLRPVELLMVLPQGANLSDRAGREDDQRRGEEPGFTSARSGATARCSIRAMLSHSSRMISSPDTNRPASASLSASAASSSASLGMGGRLWWGVSSMRAKIGLQGGEWKRYPVAGGSAAQSRKGLARMASAGLSASAHPEISVTRGLWRGHRPYMIPRYRLISNWCSLTNIDLVPRNICCSV